MVRHGSRVGVSGGYSGASEAPAQHSGWRQAMGEGGEPPSAGRHRVGAAGGPRPGRTTQSLPDSVCAACEAIGEGKVAGYRSDGVAGAGRKPAGPLPLT